MNFAKDKPEATEGKKKKKMPEEPVQIKTVADYQRMKLNRLFANPDKPINIPETRKSKDFPSAPEFVRNIMGSSAGAGSGEFHVYRHLRRKEYAREKYIKEKAFEEQIEIDFRNQQEENKKKAAEKTAKKRAKRNRKKQKTKMFKKSKGNSDKKSSSSSSSESEDNEDGDAKEKEKASKSDKDSNTKTDDVVSK